MRIHWTTFRQAPSLLAAAAAAFALSAGASRAAETGWDEPRPDWKNGPVRMVLTKDEEKAYKTLKTDEERKRAVEEFWTRRDPTPGTPENEYRAEFFKRVEDANKQFREAGPNGWATDRGKLLLIAGYPAQKSVKGEAEERWNYAGTSLASKLSVQPHALEIAFTRDDQGAFRMDSNGDGLVDAVRHLDPAEAAKASMPAVAFAPAAAVSKPQAPAAIPPAASPGAAAPAASAAAVEDLPAGIEPLRAALLSGEKKEDLPVSISTRYFKSGDGSTHAVVMTSVKKTDVGAGDDGKPKTLLYARLTRPGMPEFGPLEFFKQDRFWMFDDAAEGLLKYAFSVTLKPAAYDLGIAASEGAGGKLGTWTAGLEFPDFGADALAVSSVTLASQTARAPADATKDDPFLVGSLRLIPRASPLLGPKDDLSWFYDVYNAKKDPATGKPSLEVTYNFEKQDGREWKLMRKTPLVLHDQHEEALGYTIESSTLSQFPEGEWRVTIRVKDTIANAEVLSTVPFSIRKPAAAKTSK